MAITTALVHNTDIADRFHFDSKSGVVSNDVFILGIDSSVVLTNTLASVIDVVVGGLLQADGFL